ncbi:DUF3514 domain-containing protein [Ehrlichia ruminantium]|uniref:DUF3514 domain-containing protein n=1 Tax=Ehrlichia ruminantium TaxID=779 RepID=UPI0015DCE213|nr:DUF3514 domain-containing protein [Ehrlichia ruminantium]QLK50921.1 DUF3514 domain-containing protein [Ehrlichia ruminantium]QLK51843.1 DUF3514 domain-containing protein [Ehrlichia ruminantium]
MLFSANRGKKKKKKSINGQGNGCETDGKMGHGFETQDLEDNGETTDHVNQSCDETKKESGRAEQHVSKGEGTIDNASTSIIVAETPVVETMSDSVPEDVYLKQGAKPKKKVQRSSKVLQGLKDVQDIRPCRRYPQHFTLGDFFSIEQRLNYGIGVETSQEVNTDVDKCSSEDLHQIPQPSSVLTRAYVKQGAKPKRKIKHSRQIQDQKNIQCIKPHMQYPQHLMLEGFFPSDEKLNPNVDVEGSKKSGADNVNIEQLSSEFEKLQTTSGRNIGIFKERRILKKHTQVLPDYKVFERFRALHTEYLCELIKELFDVENDILIFRNKYYTVLSDITSSVDLSVTLIKLNLVSQLAFIVGIHKVGLLMLSACLSNQDFYVIDGILRSAVLYLQKCRTLKDYCCRMRDEFECYCDCQIDYLAVKCAYYDPSLYKALRELLVKLAYAKLSKENSYSVMMNKIIDFIVVSCSIQLGFVRNSVNLHRHSRHSLYMELSTTNPENVRLVTVTYNSVRLRSMYAIKSILSENPVICLSGMNCPSRMFDLCSPNFIDKWSELVAHSCARFEYIMSNISNNIVGCIDEQNLYCLDLLISVYENMVFGIADDVRQLLGNNTQKKKQCGSGNKGYGR